MCIQIQPNRLEDCKFFPKCPDVYGVLLINEKTDLTEAQLAKVFRNMTVLVGGIRIENTNYSSLSFFTKLDGTPINVYCFIYGVFIQNNHRMTNNTIFPDMVSKYWRNEQKWERRCNFWLMNNTMLDAEKVCQEDLPDHYKDLRVEGNARDCAFQGADITESTLSDYESRFITINGLHIFNVSDTSKLHHLANITRVIGPINIMNSDMQNLSFLNLNLLQYRVKGIGNATLHLQNNPKMTRLGLNQLSNIENLEPPPPSFGNVYETGVFVANFESLHPEFCLTMEEVGLFLKYNVGFQNLHARLCEVTGDGSSLIPEEYETLVMCKFISMKELPNNCFIVLGDLIIDSGDEEEVPKLDMMRHLFGALIVRNTKLQDFSAFHALHNIVHLDDGPVIQITNNTKLRKSEFWSLLNILDRGNRTAIIQDNRSGTFQKSQCSIISSSSSMFDTEMKNYRTRLNYVGGDCGKRIELTNISQISLDSWCLALVVFFSAAMTSIFDL